MCTNCTHIGVCKYTYETDAGETRSMFKECSDFKPEKADILFLKKEADRMGYLLRKKKK